MKRFFVVTLAIVLALSLSGLAFAENEPIDNKAYVDQAGSLNAASVAQESGINTAGVSQSGRENSTNLRQGGYETNDGVVATYASVSQVGNKNAADVDQVGARYNNQLHQAFVVQDGEHNYASIVQKSTYHGALAGIAQHGVNNTGVIEQVGNQFPSQGGYGSASIDQYGVSNYAKQWQRSYVNTGFMRAGIDQNGDHNYATQGQDHRYVSTSAPGAFELYVTQNGYKNESIQHQGQEFGTRYGSVVQNGDRNYASQTQEMGNHVAGIVQNGNANWAVINQYNSVPAAK